ncbi:MAG: UvrD-helicase domain-containing protein, partial [Oscillospiraceae bacterium]|nr:UvrD-helicase domain-containing protein [Oscillospiraceae bacterium]
QRCIRDLFGFTRNLTADFAESWLEKQSRLYGDADLFYAEVAPLYYNSVRESLEKAIDLTNESLKLAEYDSTMNFLNADLEYFTGLYDSDNPSDFVGELVRMSINKNEDNSVKDVIRENRKAVKKIKDETDVSLTLMNREAFGKSVEKLCPYVRILIRLYRIYEAEFTKVKRLNKVLDFPDTERLCIELLRKSERIRDIVSGQYDLIIVDEFQDSNFLQYELFRLLDNGRNRLFLVGDLKQSIYGFRGADCTVFDEVAANPDYEVIHLSKNFRSSDEVIAGVNRVFEGVMDGYDDKARLQSGRGISRNDCVTELCLLNNDSDNESDSATAEAEYTAFRINEMISNGFEVYDKDGNPRKCSYGDFAVLTSAGEKNFKVYERVFRDRGIPCASSGGGGYFKTEEIGLALDLLTVISNPYNDLSLLNIMMSPLFCFSAEEMAQIRAKHRKMPLYSAVLASVRKNTVSNVLLEKVGAFLQTVSRYRRISDVGNAADLIAQIQSDGGFFPLINPISTDSNNSKFSAAANIQLLSYYAERFQTSGAGRSDSGLAAFLTYIKSLNKADVDVRQANVMSQTGSSVRLMTIHGAKGLEFPVCFVGRVNTSFNFRGDKSVLVRFGKESGITADWFDEESLCRFKTLLSDYEKRVSRAETVAEEKRKLYVAGTRAEFKLIFTGFVRNEVIKEHSYAAWLVKSGIDVHMVENYEHSGNVRDSEEREQVEEIRDVPDVLKNIGVVYPREVLFGVPRKLTATQVGVCAVYGGDREYDEVSVFPRNPSFHGEKRLTGKKRGDAYHKAMELLDFSGGDYFGQIQRLESRFTPLEWKALDFVSIAGFFGSELGSRAVASGRVVKEYKLYTEITLSEIGVDYAESGDKPFIQGIADMFFYEEGEIVLVDYKTNRNTSAEKLIHDYKGQLYIYKKAIEEMTGVRVKECWIYSFELGGLIINNE